MRRLLAMTYATREDLAERFGLTEIRDLENGEPARISDALTDAAAEIDAALATLYVLPLAPEGAETEAEARWPLLAHIACNLARANLYDDRESETVTNRKRSARARLLAIGDNKIALVDAAGRRARKRETARAQRAGPEPVMTPDNLAGL